MSQKEYAKRNETGHNDFEVLDHNNEDHFDIILGVVLYSSTENVYREDSQQRELKEVILHFKNVLIKRNETVHENDSKEEKDRLRNANKSVSTKYSNGDTVSYNILSSSFTYLLLNS